MPITRTSLLVRLRADGDPAGWHEFVQLYEPLFHNWARRAGVREHDIRILACGTTPASRSSTAWLTGQLRRVQSELRHVAPQFDALLFASGGVTDSSTAQAAAGAP